MSLLLLLAVLSASSPRPVIQEVAPARIAVTQGGERYLSLRVANFLSEGRSVILFSGAGGDFTRQANSYYPSTSTVQVWIPEAILTTAGRYSVVVRNEDNVDSAPAYFEVIGGAAPVLHLPPQVTLEAAGPSGSIATYEAAAYQADGYQAPMQCAPASGSLFPVGWTDVTCTAMSDEGVSASGRFKVAILDRTPPVMTHPPYASVEATSSAGAIVHFETSATDVVDGNVPVSCYPASGTQFRIGNTEVRCVATDRHTNSTIRTIPVTVYDNARPMLMLPDDIAAEATSESGAIVTFTVSAMDYAERTIPASCSPESGSQFPIGITVVTCTATDDRELVARGTFEVHVTQAPPPGPAPILTLSADLTIEATSESGAHVTFEATAKDYANRTISVTCNPASGSLFPVGTTSVTCSATDDRAQTSSGSFEVTVTTRPPVAPPVLTLPADITAEATSEHGAIVSFVPTAHDAVDGAIAVTCAPPSGSLFPHGSTIVTCSATNAAGITASGAFAVQVVDGTAPVIHSISVTPSELWPPNGQYAAVVVTVNATDDADAALDAQIVNVQTSETVTADDWRITGALTADLRAERNGKERPRIYTLVVAVADDAGNVATATVTVTVPHDKAEAPASATRRRAIRR